MKIKNSNRFRINVPKFVTIALAFVFLLGAAWYGSTALLNKSTLNTEIPSEPTDQINYSPPSDDEKQASASTKEQSLAKPGEDSGNAGSTSNISVFITRAGQVGSGQAVSVRTLIDGATSGTCTLEFSKEGQASFRHETTIAYEATTAHCNTDVDVSKFNEGGEWSLSITAQKDSSTSEPATQIIDVTK